MTLSLGSGLSVATFGDVLDVNSSVGVSASLDIYNGSAKTVNFADKSTVTINGNITADDSLTGASISVGIYSLDSDSLIQSLYSGTKNLGESITTTLTTINSGNALTWSAVPGLYYTKLEISHVNIKTVILRNYFTVTGVASNGTLDPYTQVLNQLWSILEADEVLAGLVKLNNRIKLTGSDSSPTKRKIQNADLPELLIEPNGGSNETVISNKSYMVSQTYQIGIGTCDLRVDKLNRVKWAITRIFSSAPFNLNLAFVRKFDIKSVSDSDNNKDENRGTEGWSSLIEITVDMYFARTNI